MRRPVVLILLIVSGCGTSPAEKSPVEYDALKNNSRIYVVLRPIRIAEGKDGDARVSLSLWGEGKHPAAWKGSIAVSAHTDSTERGRSVLGESPTLRIYDGYSGGRTIRAVLFGPMEDSPRPWSDTAYFDIPLDDLIPLAGYGKFEVNGKSYTMSREQRKLVEAAIVAAREDTNAGR